MELTVIVPLYLMKRFFKKTLISYNKIVTTVVPDGFNTNNSMCACNPRFGSMFSLLDTQHYEHMNKTLMWPTIFEIHIEG